MLGEERLETERQIMSPGIQWPDYNLKDKREKKKIKGLYKVDF
jgi:hypothetical protein